MSALTVDLALVRKYNVPGPRYTSYPPATHFTEEVGATQLVDKIRANNETQRDLSLYYHVPFCQTLCWYCGCTTVITTQQSASEKDLAFLEKEMDLMGQWLNPKRKVTQLHFGGGTPTFLTPAEIRKFGEGLHRRFEFSPDAEAGVEIDPRRIVRDHITALREAGFNRASIGVQDHNEKVQKAVHRIQPYEETKAVVDWIREAGFESLNIDLIYGLPHQSPQTFERTIAEVLTLKPNRFAVFSYAHVPWIKPAQRIFTPETMPSAKVKLELLKLTIEKLTSEGYVYIGMDHFAREDDELAMAQKAGTLQRNFQGYSTRGGADIYAFGMSSISQTDACYWQNIKELPAYYDSIEAGKTPFARGYLMTHEDQVRRQTIMRLMCDMSLDYKAMSQYLEMNFAEHFAPELASLDDMEADGLVKRSAEGLKVTHLGRLFIRNIAMRFDAYRKNEEPAGRFSRTI